jgi:3-oxoacyl-[acyl-carrier-protein] synthase-3
MYKNVHIVGLGSYHPERILHNNYFENHFEKYNLTDHAKGLARKLGRNRRTLANEGENSITMSYEAAIRAINNANLTALDIDAIICVSDTPEYLTPCCALILRNKLGAANATNVFDINNDCIGMITGVDIAARYLKTDKKYKRILVIGSIVMSNFAREDDLVMYSCFSDGASAVILEAKEEETLRGIIDSKMYTDCDYNEYIRFPVCGLTNMWKDETDEYDRKIKWDPFDFSFLSDKWVNLITGILDENSLASNDIKHYFMSQFSKTDLNLTIEKLGLGEDKAIFIGEKYGYTGCTSPFMALEEKVQSYKFKENDLSIFCSVAAGYTMAALLYKW